MTLEQVNQALDNVGKQQQVVAEIHDLLMVGSFNGANAQKLVMGQAYMKSVHESIAAEIKRLEEVKAEIMKPSFTEALKTEIAK